MDSFARDRGWPVRIVRCKEAEEGRPPEDRTFPVFAVVATKFKRMENAIPVRNINQTNFSVLGHKAVDISRPNIIGMLSFRSWKCVYRRTARRVG